jgi:hypothetical protein
VVEDLVQRVRDLHAIVGAAPMERADRDALAVLARTSLHELEAAIRNIESAGRTGT